MTWHNESKRHALARKGIKSAQQIPYNLLITKNKNELTKAFNKYIKNPNVLDTFIGQFKQVSKTSDGFIIKTGNTKVIKQECRIQKLLHNTFHYYPDCKYVNKDGVSYLITSDFGNSLDELSINLKDLSNKNKQRVALVLKFLYKNGFVINDISTRNLSMSNDGIVRINDFDTIDIVSKKVGDPYNKKWDELEYNLSVKAVIGNKFNKQFLTMSNREMNIAFVEQVEDYYG